MSIAKIQTGDQVKVISGNYKGTTGQVIKVVKKVLPNGKIRIRASVNSIPKIVKYRKSNVVQGQKYAGLMSQVDRTVDISNLSLVTSDFKVSKSKVVVDDSGKKTRVLKKTGESVTSQKIVKTKSLEKAE
jgi:large subunit ribosomal protein L24